MTCPPVIMSEENSYSVSSHLAGVNNEAFSHIFMDSLEIVFQYTKSDIQNILVTKDMDTLNLVQEALYEKAKVLFPLYSSRRPRKRQVVNTIAGDIWSLGFSICNKAPVRDLDKILVPISTDPSSQEAEDGFHGCYHGRYTEKKLLFPPVYFFPDS